MSTFMKKVVSSFFTPGIFPAFFRWHDPPSWNLCFQLLIQSLISCCFYLLLLYHAISILYNNSFLRCRKIICVNNAIILGMSETQMEIPAIKMASRWDGPSMRILRIRLDRSNALDLCGQGGTPQGGQRNEDVQRKLVVQTTFFWEFEVWSPAPKGLSAEPEEDVLSKTLNLMSSHFQLLFLEDVFGQKIQARSRQVIQRLLELKPQMSLNSSDQLGQTALDHAVQGNQQELWDTVDFSVF